jgi:hypothetical protein
MIQIQQEEGKRQGVGLDKSLLGEEVTIIGKYLIIINVQRHHTNFIPMSEFCYQSRHRNSGKESNFNNL